MDTESAFDAAKKLPDPRPGMTLPKCSLEVALAYISMHRLEKEMFWGDRLIVKFAKDESLVEFAEQLSK